MSHLAEVIDRYRNQSQAEADKGRRFGRLEQAMLRSVPPYSGKQQVVWSSTGIIFSLTNYISMRMKFFIVGVAVCAASAVAAQSAVVSTGGEAVGQGYALSYTVGQVAMTMTQAGETILGEGVQQSTAVTVERIDVVDALPEVSVFPNPTDAYVTLRRDVAEDATSVTLFDGTGRALTVQTWSDESMTLDLTAQPSGVYVVRVAQGDNRVKNYKIDHP